MAWTKEKGPPSGIKPPKAFKGPSGGGLHRGGVMGMGGAKLGGKVPNLGGLAVPPEPRSLPNSPQLPPGVPGTLGPKRRWTMNPNTPPSPMGGGGGY